MKKFLLLATDGYSIESTEYSTKEKAQEAMKKAYNELHPKENEEEWEEMSYLGEENALLYANGESVYCWDITGVETGFIPSEYLKAYKGTTTNEDLAKAEKLVEREISIIEQLMKEMSEDDTDDSSRLIWLYQNVDEETRGILDMLLVSLCGYTLHTIIEHIE